MSKILAYIGLFLLVVAAGEGIYTKITLGEVLTSMDTFLTLIAIGCFAGSSAFRSTK